MNKTKRKIFEASMKLFAEKGYDATSIEEITATVGVAKGTLYYHFSSKEEIFNFLVDEGKMSNSLDKLRAVVLIQIKLLFKYENFMTIILSQIWGNDERNKLCKKYLFEYIQIIEKIVKDGIKKGEIVDKDANVIASGIFGFTCSSYIYKMKHEKVNVQDLFKQIDSTFLKNLRA